MWQLALGMGLTLLVGGYMVAYSWSSGTLNRYAGGFAINRCPVCGEGYLILEERPYTVLGIPRVRRTVRCDNCRSVLREVGRRQWRYAVDPAENPPLYDMLNNEVISENELKDLAEDYADDRPSYVDDMDDIS